MREGGWLVRWHIFGWLRKMLLLLEWEQLELCVALQGASGKEE
jgi:hypothetical protein